MARSNRLRRFNPGRLLHSLAVQEYTLVAVVAVAAHLSQHNLGERYGLPALAKRYKQDVDALEQVGRGWGWVWGSGRAPVVMRSVPVLH